MVCGQPPGRSSCSSLSIKPTSELPDQPEALLLASGARGPSTDLSADDLTRMIDGDDVLAHDSMPLFAVLGYRTGTREINLVTDALGFRQVYMAHGDGWAALSTSAPDLGQLTAEGLDRSGLAVQSLLGWQLGDRTLFKSVTRVPARTRVVLDQGMCRMFTSPPPEPTVVALPLAVREAAQFLRDYVAGFLEDHPDATLQLTGGQDSRLLLSAVPPLAARGSEP